MSPNFRFLPRDARFGPDLFFDEFDFLGSWNKEGLLRDKIPLEIGVVVDT
jgi:hypothetical protein